jgi:2-amino-4-hydroxy-6-hydroxymethyldihydropteridine diphosphokinase
VNPIVYLSLGSNLGDRLAHLETALARLQALRGIRLLRRSSIYETDPVGRTTQPRFLNLVAELTSALSPDDLLAAIHLIERQAGRNRSLETRWGPRTLDLDILLFGDTVLESPHLTLPHARMAERRFVLTPLLELAPDLRNPLTGALLSESLPLVEDQSLAVISGPSILGL